MGHYTQLSILESATLTTFVYLLDTECLAFRDQYLVHEGVVERKKQRTIARIITFFVRKSLRKIDIFSFEV